MHLQSDLVGLSKVAFLRTFAQVMKFSLYGVPSWIFHITLTYVHESFEILSSVDTISKPPLLREVDLKNGFIHFSRSKLISK